MGIFYYCLSRICHDAGKHVFVEKPLVINEEQLDDVIESYQKANTQKPTGLMVGLNAVHPDGGAPE